MTIITQTSVLETLSQDNFEIGSLQNSSFDKVLNIFKKTVHAATAVYLSSTALGITLLPQAGGLLSVAYTVYCLASVIVGMFIAPASLMSLNSDNVDMPADQRESLQALGFHIRNITLTKDGVDYDAYVVGHASTIENGHWMSCPLGNAMLAGTSIYNIAWENAERYAANTLIVNGPRVGRSASWPGTVAWGDAQEAGLQFLENVIRANHIVVKGFSLGGGSAGQALLNHEFSDDIQYMAVWDRTFSSLADTADLLMFPGAGLCVRFLNNELLTMPAVRRLHDLNIQQIVIQNDTDEGDGVIPGGSSLRGACLQDEDLDIEILADSNMQHNTPLPVAIATVLQERIQGFLTRNP